MNISILICAYSQNQQYDQLLGRALDSLSCQTYDGDFETVVVLDECWEGTRPCVEHWGDVLDLKIYERPRKQGLAIAKNFGLAKCTGDWIGFLDADDQYMPCKLEVQSNFLIQNTEIDVCGTLAWDYYDNYTIKPSCFNPGQYQTHGQILAALPRENVMCHGSILVRRTALEKVGFYPTDKLYLGREDWDLWSRLIRAGYKFHNIPERS